MIDVKEELMLGFEREIMEYIQLAKQFYKDKSEYDSLYQRRFQCESTVHIPVLIHGNEAFFTYSEEVIKRMIDIYKEDKRLNTILGQLPEIARSQFILKSLIDEIKASNDIEGVYSTRKEIHELLTAEGIKQHGRRAYGLLQKYKMLIDGKRIPMESCHDIRSLYDELLLYEIIKENPANKPDGIWFRKEPVHIQASDLKIIHSGVYPEKNIILYMEEALRLINDKEICRLAALSAFHYLFGYIHPFYDGNGRLNRFISSYLLSEELTYTVGFGLSNAILKERSTYYNAFKITNDKKNRGDLTPFIITFLELVLQSIKEMATVLFDKYKQLTYYDKVLDTWDMDDNRKNMIYMLVQNTLFGEVGMSVEEIAAEMKLSIPSIRNYLKALDENMLIVSKSGRRKLYDMNLNYFYSREQ